MIDVALVSASAASGYGPLIIFGTPVVIFLLIRNRLVTRPCPRCGNRVKRGQLKCYACGFDFNTIGAEPGGQ